MISNLSSLIQLFAAIYLTMCFENPFLDHFWTKDFTNKISSVFDSVDMPEVAKATAFSSAKYLSDSFRTRMSKRGTFMLVISVFLLIVIGFEKGIVTRTGYIGLSYSYIAFAILTLVFFWSDRKIMKHWQGVYICIIILLGLFSTWVLIVPFFPCYGPFWMQYSFGLKLIAKVLIIIAVILPVVWLLYVNWLYSESYLDYVIAEVSKVVVEFEKALNFDGEEDDIESIKECYKDLVLQRLEKKNENKPVESLLKEFKTELLKVDYYPVFFPLVGISRRKNRKKNAKSEKSN